MQPTQRLTKTCINKSTGGPKISNKSRKRILNITAISGFSKSSLNSKCQKEDKNCNMDDVQGDLIQLPRGTATAALIANKQNEYFE